MPPTYPDDRALDNLVMCPSLCSSWWIITGCFHTHTQSKTFAMGSRNEATSYSWDKWTHCLSCTKLCGCGVKMRMWCRAAWLTVRFWDIHSSRSCYPADKLNQFSLRFNNWKKVVGVVRGCKVRSGVCILDSKSVSGLIVCLLPSPSVLFVWYFPCFVCATFATLSHMTLRVCCCCSCEVPPGR